MDQLFTWNAEKKEIAEQQLGKPAKSKYNQQIIN